MINSALELMQSRYEAYTRADIDYIAKTSCTPLSIEDQQFLLQWAKESHWQSLEIVESSEFVVEFKAYYIYQGIQRVHHERSSFEEHKGEWCYKEGELFETKVVIGRNEPCICGSGKKYKKCCATLIK
jgi:SEC-C motif-containing protein